MRAREGISGIVGTTVEDFDIESRLIFSGVLDRT